MLEASEVIAFAASADLRQARAFHEQELGLRVIEQNDFACVPGSPIRPGTSCRSPSSPDNRAEYPVDGAAVRADAGRCDRDR